jgi:hypothetical protein
MINFLQTPIQIRIEDTVTNGLGFDSKAKYSEENGIFQKYRRFISEEKVKETNSGLIAHLAEMNLDKEMRGIFRKYGVTKEKFKTIRRFLAKTALIKIYTRNEILKQKAFDEAYKNLSGNDFLFPVNLGLDYLRYLDFENIVYSSSNVRLYQKFFLKNRIP